MYAICDERFMSKGMRFRSIVLALLLLAASAGAVQARQRYALTEGWRFYFSDENSGDRARTVSLPHTWNTAPSVLIRSAANYDRTLYIPAEWQGRRLFLRFGGAQTVADVFVNGAYAGGHAGAYTAFAMEITDKVRYGADNLLHVVVSNAWRSDVLPASTEQNLGGGLTRGVELIVTDETAVSPVYCGTEGVLIHHKNVTDERADAEAEVHIVSNHAGLCDVTLRVTDPSGYVAIIRRQRSKGDGDRTVTIPFSIDMPLQWRAGAGRMYSVTAIVVPDGDTERADTVEVRTGFRTVRATAEGGFRIGGERLQLCGVRMMHDSPTRGAAMTEEDYDRDLALVRELGANAVRSEGGPHAQYLYNRCDELGIVAWVDLPLTQTAYLSDMGYFDSPAFRENGRQQLREIILQNINHPAVAMWGIFSLLQPHGDVVEYIRELKAEAAALDSSRPTVACSNRNGDMNFVSDLIVWQQNIGWERGLLSDVGRWCEQLRDGWSHLASGATYGEEGDVEIRQERPDRESGVESEVRQTEMHEEYAAAICDNPMFWGVWINSLADYASSRRTDRMVNTGLVTADRNTRKDAFWLYKSLWNSAEPTLYITSRRVTERSSAPQRITVYSSAGEPTLTVGDMTVEMEEVSRCRYRSAEFTPEPGRHTVSVTAGGLNDRIEINVKSPLVRP